MNNLPLGGGALNATLFGTARLAAAQTFVTLKKCYQRFAYVMPNCPDYEQVTGLGRGVSGFLRLAGDRSGLVAARLLPFNEIESANHGDWTVNSLASQHLHQTVKCKHLHNLVYLRKFGGYADS